MNSVRIFTNEEFELINIQAKQIPYTDFQLREIAKINGNVNGLDVPDEPSFTYGYLIDTL